MRNLVANEDQAGSIPVIRSAGWSSLEAREAHNLQVTGSNPVPATESNAAQEYTRKCKPLGRPLSVLYLVGLREGCGRRSDAVVKAESRACGQPGSTLP